MDVGFVPVHHCELPRNIVLRYPETETLRPVSWFDSAVSVMTDFSRTTPFCVEPGVSLDDALERMRTCGVRLLFVTDNDRVVLGLITAADLLGEKPVQYLRNIGGVRNHISVENIMTPIDHLQGVEWADVISARVGNIVETIRLFGRQHLLTMETGDMGATMVRGIFSATQISRQVGTEIFVAPTPTLQPQRIPTYA